MNFILEYILYGLRLMEINLSKMECIVSVVCILAYHASCPGSIPVSANIAG